MSMPPKRPATVECSARTLLDLGRNTSLVTERVQCAECERIYDSDEHPFCPRCGATAQADPAVAARSIASRNEPRRRRVQVAGVIMLSTGALVLLAGIFMVASAGAVWDYATTLSNEPDTVGADLTQAASAINVSVLQGGEPVEGANVTLWSGQMQLIASRITDADGQARFEGITSLVVDLNVHHDDVDWDLSFIAINPTSDPDYALPVTLELSDRSVVGPPLMDERMVENTTRVLGIGAILLGVTPVVGGIAALRLRNQQLALFGGIIGAIPWLFLFVASLSISVLLIMALFVMAVVFVRQGRDLFV